LGTDLETMTSISDLEAVVAAGRSLSRAEADRVAACPDLPIVGMLGELARTVKHGRRVTYVRVCEVPRDGVADPTDAGEIRLLGSPESADEGRPRVEAAVQAARGVVVTGFCLGDLWHHAGADAAALERMAGALKGAGLDAIAEAPLDVLGDQALPAVRAALAAGLGVRTATVKRAAFADRLSLIERAIAVQRETGAFKAFAPLPRVDPQEEPATGYDDVRTIALARLMCGDIPSIQVDWGLYGPKLAQVAIAFGADDLDRIPAAPAEDLGRRRSPKEDIERHIRMAFADPVERDGRYEPRP
jgi:aminodeoxyfutalosine synthase